MDRKDKENILKPDLRASLIKIQSGEINASSPEARKMMTEGFSADPEKAAKLLDGVDKSLQARSMKEAGHDSKEIGKTLHEGDPFGLRAYFMQEKELLKKANTPGHDKNGYPEDPDMDADIPEPDPHEVNPEHDMNNGPRPR